MSETTTPRGPGRPPSSEPLTGFATSLPPEAAAAVRQIAERDCLAESAVIRLLVLEALRARTGTA